jgi:hypothetical protein
MLPLDAFEKHATLRYVQRLWHFVGAFGKSSRAPRGMMSSMSFAA